MPRASVRTRSTSMEARVAALEALGSKNQLLLESNQRLLESMQRLLEDKFASIDKRFESIEARLEGSNEKDGESSRRRGGLDPREKEKGYPSDGRMPFVKMDFPRFNDGDIPAATAEDVEIAVEAAKKAFSRNKGKDWSSVSGLLICDPSTSNIQLRDFFGKSFQTVPNHSDFELFSRQISPRDNSKLEKLYHGTYALPSLPSVHDVDSIEEFSRGPPKFTQTTHRFFITKKTDVNLPDGAQIFKLEAIDSGNHFDFFKWEDFVKIFCRDFGSHGFEDYYKRYSRLDFLISLRNGS